MNFRLPDWLRYEMQQRWERTAGKLLVVRNWLNQRDPRIIIGITCVSAIVLVVVAISLLIPEKTAKIEESEKAWFYDLNTGRLFTAKSDLIPPIEAPSGPLPDGEPAGVKAYVFSYAFEPNESERFIGFLEIADPNAKEDSAVFIKSKITGAEQWGRGKLIRRVEDEYWFAGDSYESRAILEEVFLPNENGERPFYCRPK